MRKEDEIWDVIVIGGGPCGLSVAIEAQKAGLRAVVLEKGVLTNSIFRYPLHMTFFSTSDNISIGGIPFPTIGPKASRSEALEYYRKVTDYFELNIKLRHAVTQVEREDVFSVYTANSDPFPGHVVVLATGYFDKPRQLEVPGFELPHVSSYYTEAHPYARSKVVIVGGGNSASETALDLYRHGAEVTMVVRESQLKPSVKYWMLPDLQNRIKEGKIKLMLNTEVQKILPDAVWVKTDGTDQKVQLEADFVLSLIGYVPDVDLFERCEIPYDPETLAPEFDAKTFETPVERLYLAGTVTAGIRTEKVFIENGRLHGEKIVADILSKISQNP